MESGKLLPGVSVIIADPESKGQCGDSNLGEIWVECPHNASGYYTIYGEDGTYGDHFAARSNSLLYVEGGGELDLLGYH